jgi:hypothetical protein
MFSTCVPCLCLTALTAPTVILDQTYDKEAGRPVPPAPTSAVLVWPRAGSYTVFDGRLGHGVLDCCGEALRVTLLINWWVAGWLFAPCRRVFRVDGIVTTSACIQQVLTNQMLHPYLNQLWSVFMAFECQPAQPRATATCANRC